MLAADTVVRYSADSSASRVQDQDKVALDRASVQVVREPAEASNCFSPHV